MHFQIFGRTTMFKIFEIKDGKVSFVAIKQIKGVLIASTIILIVTLLASWFKINDKDLWKFYNIVLDQFGLRDSVPNLDKEKEIEARVELEVDRAIQNVIPEYESIIREADQKYKPRYIEEKNDESVCYTNECKALAPPMRICAPWVEDCLKN